MQRRDHNLFDLWNMLNETKWKSNKKRWIIACESSLTPDHIYEPCWWWHSKWIEWRREEEKRKSKPTQFYKKEDTLSKKNQKLA